MRESGTYNRDDQDRSGAATPSGIHYCVSCCRDVFKVVENSSTFSATVEVRIPHARHGNAGKPSHAAKLTILECFLQFIDCNTQPNINGRAADSTGPTFYFTPQFTTIQTPKKGVSHYEDRLHRSVVGKFKMTQRESGIPEMSNGSLHNWLRTHQPKVAICPHKEDYCDTCIKNKTETK